ncbi:Mitochondrial 18 kDa protein [Aphelenchoides bicaudatus]|nr:Mitochondrial 18 kDa protein [Aphelenchoides bicaudatus]
MEDQQISITKRLLYEVQQKWGSNDLYRETPIRYLGYANEIGEAFRALVPVNVVRLSYVIASGYVLADSLDKAHAAYKRPYTSHSERQKHTGIAFLDTLAWQGFASVVLPGVTINRLCATVAWILKRSTKLSPAPAKLLTTSIGLAAIPFIVKPIDASVEVGMNKWVRPLYMRKVD